MTINRKQMEIDMNRVTVNAADIVSRKAIIDFCRAFGLYSADTIPGLKFKYEDGVVAFSFGRDDNTSESESDAIRDGEIPLTKEMLDNGEHKGCEYVRRIDDGSLVVKF